MMILAIAVSTMVLVGIVVFAMQYAAYKKDQIKRGRVSSLKHSAGATQEAPIAS